MNIGFIGAGRVGVTFGRYFGMNGYSVAGYYSRSVESSREAADLTGSKIYEKSGDLVAASDVIFVTVPDDAISAVWNELKKLPLEGKVICHCSGSLSSGIFEGIEELGAFGYSVHPLLAVSDKYSSYRNIGGALITIEGSDEKLEYIIDMIKNCGNRTESITADKKIKYHAAASVASNLMIGLVDMACSMLEDCGFSHENALNSLAPLMEGNLCSALQNGPVSALTGPVERCDIRTVKKHMDALDEEERHIYKLLSRRILEVAKQKNKQCDYGEMEEILAL